MLLDMVIFTSKSTTEEIKKHIPLDKNSINKIIKMAITIKENNYYVYLHIKETTGEPFYIGKGKGNRAKTTLNAMLTGQNKNKTNLKYYYD